ncbi:MAG: hypothetical protein ACP5QD_08050, partial [Candidatus Ratteibacteria bacterium]
MLVKNPIYTALKRIQTRPVRLFCLIAGEILSLFIVFLLMWIHDLPLSKTDYEMFLRKVGENFTNFILILQYIGLVVYGTFSIESRIVRDRISDIINFHRITPLSPDSIIFGYIFGQSSDALIFWYVCFFFGIVGTMLGGINASQYLACSALILMSAMFFYSLAVWSGLNKSLYLKSGARSLWGFASVLAIICPLQFGLPDIALLSPLPSIVSILPGETSELLPVLPAYVNFY